MKLCVLEWLCGGGLTVPTGDRSEASGAQEAMHAEQQASLMREGWGMIQSLLRGTSSAHEPVVVVDQRINDLGLNTETIGQATARWLEPAESTEQLLRAWEQIAAECDKAIIIAPECDRILEHAVAALGDTALGDTALGDTVDLINCESHFIALAADKLQSARELNSAGIAHPPTVALADVTDDWLEATRAEFANDRWVVKPVDGAGSQQIHVMRDESNIQLTPEVAIDCNVVQPRTVVQPWIAGIAASVLVLVDADEQVHYAPLMTQEFRDFPNPKYVGGGTAPQWLQQRFPRGELDRLFANYQLKSTGWVGVDLVFEPQQGKWYVIEINPRCTSSLIGLVDSYRGHLTDCLIDSCQPGFPGFIASWEAVRFAVDGNASVPGA